MRGRPPTLQREYFQLMASWVERVATLSSRTGIGSIRPHPAAPWLLVIARGSVKQTSDDSDGPDT